MSNPLCLPFCHTVMSVDKDVFFLSLGHPQNLLQHSVTAHSPQVNQEAVEGVCVPGNQVIQSMLQNVGVRRSGRTQGRHSCRLHLQINKSWLICPFSSHQASYMMILLTMYMHLNAWSGKA